MSVENFSVVDGVSKAVAEKVGIGRASLGEIQVGDQKLQVQFGLTRYPRRLVDHPEQPRVTGENVNPVLRLVDDKGIRALAYRKDVEELPVEVVKPLIAHLSSIKI